MKKMPVCYETGTTRRATSKGKRLAGDLLQKVFYRNRSSPVVQRYDCGLTTLKSGFQYLWWEEHR
ncbi:uncharacterized protein LOC143232381 isoform X3 [Tachypleus tridentatus]|uniref:uncharacterized protein LOC143232381 isoform X3 n=1 Tax=Tachypleus tridentatus TaxID=6853 RepID=UPI003FD597FA